MLKRRLVLPSLLAFSVLGLAACGGGGGDQAQIEVVIGASATSTDPANCTKLQTQNFVEQENQESGKAALAECEKDAEEPTGNAKSVAVSEVEIDGSTATANAALSGGSFDGQTVEVELVKDGDQWKVNELTGFAELDKAKLIEAFEREFAKPSNEVSESLASCLVEGFEEDSRLDFEELLLGSTSEPIEAMIEACS